MSWIGVGHRGTPKEFPGNTLRGFARAIEYGCAMVECDVRLSSDGILVLSHDPHVTDGRGRLYAVSDTSAATLANLDLGAGEGVPTLQDLVELTVGRCAVMADMKCDDNAIEAQVVAALARLPLDARIVPGAGEESRRKFRSLDPMLPLSLSLDRNTAQLTQPEGFWQLLPVIDTDAVTWEYPLLNAERITALHARGLKVYAWTVDDITEMQRLVVDGVDGIISNRADLLATLHSSSARG